MSKPSLMRFGPTRIMSRSKLGFWLGPFLVFIAMFFFACHSFIPLPDFVEKLKFSLPYGLLSHLDATPENASYLTSFSNAIWPLAVIGFGLLVQGHTELRDISLRFAGDLPQKQVLDGLSSVVEHARSYTNQMTRVFQLDHNNLKPELKTIAQSLPDFDAPERAIVLAAKEVRAKMEVRKASFVRNSATTVALFGFVASLGPLQDLVPTGWTAPVGEALAEAYGIEDDKNLETSVSQDMRIASLDPSILMSKKRPSITPSNCVVDYEKIKSFKKEQEFFSYVLGLQNRCALTQANHATSLMIDALEVIEVRVSELAPKICGDASCTASDGEKLAELKTDIKNLNNNISTLKENGQFTLALTLISSDGAADKLIKHVLHNTAKEQEAVKIPISFDIKPLADLQNFQDAWLLNAIRTNQSLDLGVNLSLNNVPTFRNNVTEVMKSVSPLSIPVTFEPVGQPGSLARLPKGCMKEPLASFFFDTNVSDRFSIKLGTRNASTKRSGPAFAQEVVSSLLADFKDRPARKLFILGTTDTRGDVLDNLKLAEKRAEHVSKLLWPLENRVLPHQGIGEAYWIMGRDLNVKKNDPNSRAVHVFDCE